MLDFFRNNIQPLADDLDEILDARELDRQKYDILYLNNTLAVTVDGKKTRHIFVKDESGLYDCKFKNKRLEVEEMPF